MAPGRLGGNNHTLEIEFFRPDFAGSADFEIFTGHNPDRQRMRASFLTCDSKLADAAT